MYDLERKVNSRQAIVERAIKYGDTLKQVCIYHEKRENRMAIQVISYGYTWIVRMILPTGNIIYRTDTKNKAYKTFYSFIRRFSVAPLMQVGDTIYDRKL